MKITLDIDRERTKQHSLKSISSKRRKEGVALKASEGEKIIRRNMKREKERER